MGRLEPHEWLVIQPALSACVTSLKRDIDVFNDIASLIDAAFPSGPTRKGRGAWLKKHWQRSCTVGDTIIPAGMVMPKPFFDLDSVLREYTLSREADRIKSFYGDGSSKSMPRVLQYLEALLVDLDPNRMTSGAKPHHDSNKSTVTELNTFVQLQNTPPEDEAGRADKASLQPKGTTADVVPEHADSAALSSQSDAAGPTPGPFKGLGVASSSVARPATATANGGDGNGGASENTTAASNGSSIDGPIRQASNIEQDEEADAGNGIDDHINWITVSEACRVSGVNKGVISRAATAGEIKTNGKNNRARRLHTGSFSQWTLRRSLAVESTSDPAEIERRAREERRKRGVVDDD